MAIVGTKRLGYIAGCIKEPSKEDPKYEYWEPEYMLVMTWILNSMEALIAKSFQYCKNVHELWKAIEMAYSRKKNHARIYQLTRELAQFKHVDKSLVDYYFILSGIWFELSQCQPLNPCCEKEYERNLEEQRIYDLLGGLNLEYETV